MDYTASTEIPRNNSIAIADAEAVQPGDTVVMSCPKCKDSWVTIVTPPTKTGAKPETSTVARHDCPGCEHKYVTEGHGKAKTDKLVHVCKMCGSEDAFCCVMKTVPARRQEWRRSNISSRQYISADGLSRPSAL